MTARELIAHLLKLDRLDAPVVVRNEGLRDGMIVDAGPPRLVRLWKLRASDNDHYSDDPDSDDEREAVTAVEIAPAT